MGFKLSTSLDAPFIQQQFREQGYAHIPRILPDEHARRIRKTMLEGTQWNLVLNDRGKHIDLSPVQLQAMTASQAAQLQQAIEEWYGVDVKVKGTPPTDWHIRARYQNENLEHILRDICFNKSIKFELHDKNVLIIF
jgi:hypothetical protein